jgi:iron complex outermembrane receptor protein
MKHRLRPRSSTLVLAALLTAGAGGAGAQGEAPTVVIGATRALPTLEAPFAVSRIDAEALRSAGPMVNLSEALQAVPGLAVSNRNNYAQDLQISARGFGARAGFGVRGLRLYADGIPASGPDGQGQVAHFDLAGAEQVEVLRGPFSALYGNSSGGVIALVSAPVREGRVEGAADSGSFGLRQGRLALALPLAAPQPGGSVAAGAGGSFTKMRLDGFRPQSAASRELAQLRVQAEGAAGSATQRLAISLSDHAQQAQDPLGLSAAQMRADPRATTPEALRFDTRKTIAQTQAGARWRAAFADGALRELALAAYAGDRGVTQWLAIQPGTQANPRHGGGVIDFDRAYSGLDLRALVALGEADLVLGVAQDAQTDLRRGFENFTGSGAAQVVGVTGRLRRDETNRATSRDAYAQTTLPLAPAWLLAAGVRSGRVTMRTEDRFPGNGDDSGRLAFRYTNPVLGLRWAVAPGFVLHASAARGFESPTLGELAYRADSGAGFNTALAGQTSRQFELGAKLRRPGLALDAALFAIDTRNEIGVLANAGGRASFQNVGRTRRSGAEAAASAELPAGLKLQAALTLLEAEYRDGFFTCAALPCAAANVPIAAGNRVAGTQRGSAWVQLDAPLFGLGRVALEWRGAARLVANDANTEAAPGYGVWALRWSHEWALGGGQALQALARVDNLADKVYAGSVIVNDTNGRFYEPAAPRQALLALRWLRKF